MLKFWVNNPKTSHISRYNNIKRMYVHKTLCSYFSSQSIFKYRNNFDVMKNANFLIFFRLWMFFFLLTSLFIISISLSLVIIRKICELLISCSLFYPKEFNICFFISIYIRRRGGKISFRPDKPKISNRSLLLKWPNKLCDML